MDKGLAMPISSELMKSLLAEWEQARTIDRVSLQFVACASDELRAAQLRQLAHQLDLIWPRPQVLTDLDEQSSLEDWVAVAAAVGQVATTALGYQKATGLMILALSLSAGIATAQLFEHFAPDRLEGNRDQLGTLLNRLNDQSSVLILDGGPTERSPILRLSRFLRTKQVASPTMIVVGIDAEVHERASSKQSLDVWDPAAIVRSHYERGARVHVMGPLSYFDLRSWRPELDHTARQLLMDLSGGDAALLVDLHRTVRDFGLSLRSVTNKEQLDVTLLLSLALKAQIPDVRDRVLLLASLQALSLSGERGILLNILECSGQETNLGKTLAQDERSVDPSALVDFLERVTPPMLSVALLTDAGNTRLGGTGQLSLKTYDLARSSCRDLAEKSLPQHETARLAESVLRRLENEPVALTRFSPQLAHLARLAKDYERLGKYNALCAPLNSHVMAVVVVNSLAVRINCVDLSTEEALDAARQLFTLYLDIEQKASARDLTSIVKLCQRFSMRAGTGSIAESLLVRSTMLLIEMEPKTIEQVIGLLDIVMAVSSHYDRLNDNGKAGVRLAFAKSACLLARRGDLLRAEQIARLALVNASATFVTDVAVELEPYVAMHKDKKVHKELALTALKYSRSPVSFALAAASFALNLATETRTCHDFQALLLARKSSCEPDWMWARAHLEFAIGVCFARFNKLTEARHCLDRIQQLAAILISDSIGSQAETLGNLISSVERGRPFSLIAEELTHLSYPPRDNSGWLPRLPLDWSQIESRVPSLDRILDELLEAGPTNSSSTPART